MTFSVEMGMDWIRGRIGPFFRRSQIIRTVA